MTAPIVKRGLQCDETRHLRRYGLLLAIYVKMSRVTWCKETKTYARWTTSVDSMAQFLNCSYTSCFDAFQLGVRLGWLKKIDGSNPFKSKDYVIVSHKDWAEAHPGQCLVGELLPWDGEDHDKLAQTLWKLSFGKCRWQFNMLAAVRSTGMTDEQIIRAWDSWFSALKEKPKDRKGWKRLPFIFIDAVKKGRVTAVPVAVKSPQETQPEAQGEGKNTRGSLLLYQ
jgi:hypothetical protein